MSHKRILVISDMHIPYHHKDAIKFLKEIKKEFKPDTVVNIGDSLDFHAISMHDSNPDLYRPDIFFSSFDLDDRFLPFSPDRYFLGILVFLSFATFLFFITSSSF